MCHLSVSMLAPDLTHTVGRPHSLPTNLLGLNPEDVWLVKNGSGFYFGIVCSCLPLCWYICFVSSGGTDRERLLFLGEIFHINRDVVLSEDGEKSSHSVEVQPDPIKQSSSEVLNTLHKCDSGCVQGRSRFLCRVSDLQRWTLALFAGCTCGSQLLFQRISLPPSSLSLSW